MNNTRNVSITIAEDKDPKAIFEILKSVGLTEAVLEGNNVRGVAVENLVQPLKTISGVVDIQVITDSKPVQEVSPVLAPVEEIPVEEIPVEKPFFTMKSRRDSI